MKGSAFADNRFMKKKSFVRSLALLITLASILQSVSFDLFASSPTIGSDVSDISEESIKESLRPKEGIYRIRNAETSEYLTVADSVCCLSEYSEEGYQIFVLKKLSSAIFSIVQENGEGALALSDLHAVMSDTHDSAARLSVTREDDGSYRISPSGEGLTGLSLTAADSLAFSEYTGNKSQKWYLESVPVSSIFFEKEEVELTVGRSVTLKVSAYPAFVDADIAFVSSDTHVAVVNENGTVTAQKNGTATISAIYGNLRAECVVTVAEIKAEAFFSQHNITQGGGWDGSQLTSLKFAGKNFAKDYFTGTSDWMDEGCNTCSFAMILNNLGATLDEGYDFRTGKTDDLEADPYTVALANSGNYGAKKKTDRLYGNPVAIDMPKLLSRFSVNGAPVSGTVKRGNITRKQIKEALDEHPEGVIVEVYISEEYRHFLVFTECINPEDDPRYYDFIVCDPSAFERENGDHVPFSQCTSYTTIGYRYSNIVSLRWINVLSTFDYSGSLRQNKISDSRLK